MPWHLPDMKRHTLFRYIEQYPEVLRSLTQVEAVTRG